MEKLSNIKENKTVLILEINTDTKTHKYLNSIWLLSNTAISIIKNSWKSSPMIIEIEWSRFTLDKKITNEIVASDLLSNQSLIFEWNQTKQREVILEVLKKQTWHFSLQEMTIQIQNKDKQIGQITVYRSLKILAKKWILDILEMPDGSKKFEIRKHHHDHIICENCDSIFEFVNEDIEKLQNKEAKKHSLNIKKHKLQLIWDECENCW